jgi:hypothetical protein
MLNCISEGGRLIILRGLPFTKLQGTWSGQSTTTLSATSPVAAPPELRVQAAAPLKLSGSSRLILARSRPSVHLLHVCAEDEYHVCIRVT